MPNVRGGEMPSSEPGNLELILQIVRGFRPTSVLDVGCGGAKYGVLFRDYLDSHWVGNAFHDPSTWKMRMVGMDIWKEYITPVHEYVYDAIIIDDMVLYFAGTPKEKFDLIFMGDVIEHVEKHVGIKVLQNCKKHLTPNGMILLSTPNFATRMNDESLACFGNKHEVHRCRWEAKEFHSLGFKCSVVEDHLLTVSLQ